MRGKLRSPRIAHSAHLRTQKRSSLRSPSYSMLPSIANTKLAALAKQFGAPFGRTQPPYEARCARQTIRCSLRSHTTTNEARCARHQIRCSLRSHKPHRDSGFFLQKSEIRCSLRSHTQSGHFLSITDRQTDRQTDRPTDGRTDGQTEN